MVLSQYIDSAKKKDGDEIGLFYLWLLKNKSAIRVYFPTEVLNVLLEKRGKHNYTLRDKKIILEESHNGIWWLCMRINVASASLYKQARLLGIKLPRTDYYPYTSAESDKLIDLCHSAPDSAIAGLISRPPYSVSSKRRRLGIKKRTLFYWNKHPEAEKYVIDNYGVLSQPQIAKNLGLSYYQVKTKIERLKKKKELIF